MTRFLGPIVTFGAIISLWELVSRLFFELYTLPPPSMVAETLFSIIVSGVLWEHLQISLMRAGGGFLVAAALAIPLGIAVGWWKLASETVGAVLEVLRPIPSLALIPLAIVWLGFGESSKIAIIAYACFFSVYVNTHAGVRNVDPLHIDVMRVYGNGTGDMLRKVVMYSILPYVFTGLRYSASVALIILVAVELVGSQSGLGFYLVQQQGFLQTSAMFAIIIVFGMVGSLANALMLALESNCIGWREGVGAEKV